MPPLRHANATGWALALLALVPLAADLPAQGGGTPAGTRIFSSAQVTYQALNGVTYSVSTIPPEGEVVVGQVGGVDLEPPGASIGDPGTTVIFRHTLRNIGNGPDNYTLAGRSRGGWAVRVYHDANGSGTLDAGDPLVQAPIALASGSTALLLLAVDVPAQKALRGVTDSLWLAGTSRFDPSVADSVVDQLQIRNTGIVVTLDKSVDRTSATTGDILTYTITYRATGPSDASNFRITDPIPAGTRYLPGTLRLNGVPLTDAAGDDPGSFDAATNRIVVALAAIAGGDTGTVTFQVRVGP